MGSADRRRGRFNQKHKENDENDMKKIILAILISACALLTQQAQAVPTPITGGISLGGGYSTNTGDLNTATSFTSFTGVFVTSVSGSYGSVPTGMNSPVVTQNPFSFNPFSASVMPLWTFMFGG